MRRHKRKDMYIDYNRSYGRRRSRRGSTIFSVFLVFVLAAAMGVGAYYAVRIKVGGAYSLNKREIDVAENRTETNVQLPEFTDLNSSDIDVTETTPDKGITNENNLSENETKDNKTTNNETTNNEITNNETINDKPNGNKSDNIKPVQEVDNRAPVRAKGIYVTAGAIMVKREEILQIADTTEINALVIDVKDDNGRITFKMENTLAHEIGATTNTISDIEDLMKILEEKDIYPIARIVAFKDPYLAEQKQEFAIKNKDGSLYRDNNKECWVNPYEKEVWDYLIEVATKAAEVGFKEIQFDYIRFSTGKGISDADFGPLAKEKTKEDIIIEFTKYAYEKLKPLGVFVSADVYGTIISSSIDAGLVGQNYVEMAKYLDYICPMIYPSHFAEGNYGVQYPDLEPFKIIRKVLTASKTMLDQIPEGEHRAKVRPWLQDFTATWIKNYQVYGGKQVREQIGAVYAAGYSEWLLWNASCNYSVDGLNEIY